MIGLLQRVLSASVTIDQKQVAEIGSGLLVLIGVEQHDDESSADKLLDKLIRYRVFADEDDKMNLSLLDTNQALLLVPQFTLAANTNSGLRPSFSEAAKPELGRQLFDYLANQAKQQISNTQTGVFGADMQVGLVNDGPVTFWLQT